jgi:hypothetical protein
MLRNNTGQLNVRGCALPKLFKVTTGGTDLRGGFASYTTYIIEDSLKALYRVLYSRNFLISGLE